MDRLFYGRWILPPIEALKYNVLGLGGDASLYGVDTWYFYVLNSLVNFHVHFILALLSVPLSVVSRCRLCMHVRERDRGHAWI